jgi:hypothetical protein
MDIPAHFSVSGAFAIAERDGAPLCRVGAEGEPEMKNADITPPARYPHVRTTED